MEKVKVEVYELISKGVVLKRGTLKDIGEWIGKKDVQLSKEGIHIIRTGDYVTEFKQG